MYNGLLHLHSVLRWVILILLLVALFKSFADRNKAFTPGHRKTGLFLMITADIMFVVGLYQWFTGPWGLKSIQANGMGNVMKNASLRFFAVEHLLGMLIAISLIHVGYNYSKKDIPDAMKHKRVILFYGLALLIILISIPWPFRTVGAGRTWFPGM
jgi:Na+-driven multidrug efflux pump